MPQIVKYGNNVIRTGDNVFGYSAKLKNLVYNKILDNGKVYGGLAVDSARDLLFAFNQTDGSLEWFNLSDIAAGPIGVISKATADFVGFGAASYQVKNEIIIDVVGNRIMVANNANKITVINYDSITFNSNVTSIIWWSLTFSADTNRIFGVASNSSVYELDYTTLDYTLKIDSSGDRSLPGTSRSICIDSAGNRLVGISYTANKIWYIALTGIDIDDVTLIAGYSANPTCIFKSNTQLWFGMCAIGGAGGSVTLIPYATMNATPLASIVKNIAKAVHDAGRNRILGSETLGGGISQFSGF